MQMGVTVDRHIDGNELPNDTFELIEWAQPETFVVPSQVSYGVALDPRANDAFTAVNRLLAAGETVFRTGANLVTRGAKWPPGTFVIPVAEGTRARLEAAT